jgi:hypothetical protein
MSLSLLDEKQFPGPAASVQFKVREKYFTKYLQVRHARSYTQIPQMLPDHISTVCTRPFARIDNVAFSRWALFTVE